MRLIDADALIQKESVMRKGCAYIEEINNAPTIDAEPAVRCKDCKYFELNHEDIEYKPCNGIEWCTNWCGGTTAEGYCCEAERRKP